MKYLFLFITLYINALAEVTPSHKITHTADDLLEVSLDLSDHKEILSAEVAYKLKPTAEWQTIKTVHTHSTVNAILPKGTTSYVYHVEFPQKQSLRFPQSGSLHVPENLKQEQRTAPKTQGQPDDKWIYKTVQGQELFMDVFYPDGYEKSEDSFPMILIFHGGSWQVGETNWHYPDCEYWASRGMVAASVDYRLGKRDKIKNVPLECMKDAQSSVRYVRKNADKLKINPDLIVAAGGSAGGQLAASLASISTPETTHQDDDTAFSAIPNAVVLWNPYFKSNYNPSEYVAADLPPTISFLGDQDPAITTKEILDYHYSLKKAGNASEYYIGHGGKHGLCNGRNPQNPFFYWSVEKIDSFLVKHGIIEGSSLVTLPSGVKKLTAPADYTAHN